MAARPLAIIQHELSQYRQLAALEREIRDIQAKLETAATQCRNLDAQLAENKSVADLLYAEMEKTTRRLREAKQLLGRNANRRLEIMRQSVNELKALILARTRCVNSIDYYTMEPLVFGQAPQEVGDALLTITTDETLLTDRHCYSRFQLLWTLRAQTPLLQWGGGKVYTLPPNNWLISEQSATLLFTRHDITHYVLRALPGAVVVGVPDGVSHGLNVRNGAHVMHDLHPSNDEPRPIQFDVDAPRRQRLAYVTSLSEYVLLSGMPPVQMFIEWPADWSAQRVLLVQIQRMTCAILVSTLLDLAERSAVAGMMKLYKQGVALLTQSGGGDRDVSVSAVDLLLQKERALWHSQQPSVQFFWALFMLEASLVHNSYGAGVGICGWAYNACNTSMNLATAGSSTWYLNPVPLTLPPPDWVAMSRLDSMVDSSYPRTAKLNTAISRAAAALPPVGALDARLTDADITISAIPVLDVASVSSRATTRWTHTLRVLAITGYPSPVNTYVDMLTRMSAVPESLELLQRLLEVERQFLINMLRVTYRIMAVIYMFGESETVPMPSAAMPLDLARFGAVS